AHALAPGLPWAAAYALGALVSPPDAPAATAFLRGLVVPRRVGTILEGESLVNDAAAIVAYRMAVAAAVSGTFSVATAGPRFVWVGTAGIAVGLAVGWLIAWLRRRIHAPEIEATISLLTPFAAFFPAEAVGVSGVLAVVASRGPRRVGGPARRGLPGARPGAPLHHRRRRPVPGARSDHFPHVHCDSDDAPRPGLLAPAIRQLAGDLRHRRDAAAGRSPR